MEIVSGVFRVFLLMYVILTCALFSIYSWLLKTMHLIAHDHYLDEWTHWKA